MYILDQSRALCSSMGLTVVGTSWCYFFNDTTLTYDMAKVGKRVTKKGAVKKKRKEVLLIRKMCEHMFIILVILNVSRFFLC